MTKANEKISKTQKAKALRVYSVWKKQYFVDVLEPKHPGTKPNDETLKSKFKAAYSKVTQEEKDAIAAELD